MKLAILDRDGVINRDSADYICSAQQWEPIEGSLEAMARLTQAGYRVAIATNQSGIGRGYFTRNDLLAMHDKLYQQLATLGGRVDGIFFCPHTPKDDCHCRKPRTGLFEQIQHHWNMDLSGVPVYGDSLRDMQAAHATGARPVLVRTGHGSVTEHTQDPVLTDIPVFDNLSLAVDTLLAEHSS